MANRLITVRFRADPRTKRLLDRLRHEKDINPSAWLRRVVDRALADEFPDVADVEGAEAPESDLQKTPIETETAPKPDPQTTPIETKAAPESDPQTPIETETAPKPDPQTTPIETKAAPESDPQTPIETETAPKPDPQTTPIETKAAPESDPQKTPVETEAAPKPDPQKTPIEAEAAPGNQAVQEPNPPQKTPIEGWKPWRLPGDTWGAILTGSRVAELPDNDRLFGTPILVTDKRDESWTTTLTVVVERTDTTIVVKNSGRPRG